MTTDEILKTLIAHRDRLNIAIDALQGTGTVTKRRGRRHVKSAAPAPPTKRRRIFTKAQRQAQAERMRQYWAEKKKQTGRGRGA